MKKTYAVIGLGKFGSYITRGLINQGESVIVCDNTQENFREFKEDLEDLYVLDSSDALALKEAGVSELDVVIVSIGENIEASTLTVMALKEAGNRKVIAKANSRIHGQLLTKVGADIVVYPERDAANHLLSELIASKVEVNIISENLSSCKVIASNIFGGKTISEIEGASIKKNDKNEIIQKIKIIAIKKEKWLVELNPELKIENDNFVVFIGDDDSIDFYVKRFEAL